MVSFDRSIIKRVYYHRAAFHHLVSIHHWSKQKTQSELLENQSSILVTATKCHFWPNYSIKYSVRWALFQIVLLWVSSTSIPSCDTSRTQTFFFWVEGVPCPDWFCALCLNWVTILLSYFLFLICWKILRASRFFLVRLLLLLKESSNMILGLSQNGHYAQNQSSLFHLFAP